MQLEDRADGEYRIHVGSMELRTGHGFMAAVIVGRVNYVSKTEVEIHRDIAISGGHPWLTSNQAIQQALLQGGRVVSSDRIRLAGCSALTPNRHWPSANPPNSDALNR